MRCWKCKTELETPPLNKLPFRAICDKCQSWLHCCKNCLHYRPGLPNDCAIPNTEWIADREKGNFCEEFSLLGEIPLKKEKSNPLLERLFGEKPEKKKNFDDLFHD